MPDDDVQLPDIRSDEHRRVLRERGKPRGAHISPDDDVPHSPHPEANAAVAEILADIRDENRRREAASGKWSIGTILGVVVSVITIFGAVATTLQGYTQLGDRLQSFGERMLSLDKRVGDVEKVLHDRGHLRDEQISNLAANNALQDERLRNITIAIEQERQARIEMEVDGRRADADLRGIVNDLAKAESHLRTDLKVWVDRAQRKGELDVPEKEAQAGLARGP